MSDWTLGSDSLSDFEKFAEPVKNSFEHVAICRGKFGREPLFYIVFKTKRDLEGFLKASDDGQTPFKTPKGKQWTFTGNLFYAQGFSNGKRVGENT